MNMYDFYTGHAFDAYEYLGAHTAEKGIVFRTFAPNAKKASLLYENEEIPMQTIYDGNFYEVTLPNAKTGDMYEYRIYSRNGNYTDHCDPYGFGMEMRPKHRSIITSLSNYTFNDTKWMKQRSDCSDKPLNIYELHLGSWRRKENGDFYQYDEIAEPLVKYLKKSGYNYVELLPISEHPCDESWGYQNTGFFAPTSRYGTADKLMKFIDILHQKRIGVILDFVSVHFAVDEYGLAQYDGTALYEYPHKDVGVSEWGSYNFMHSRGEVRSFLQSCASYWLKEFHFDGIRMDAISRIIYWQGDETRGENGNAIDFIKVMNHGLKKQNPGCILIAEDSTNYPKVTEAVGSGGLGFDYKWDMGWMHDTLSYFQSMPEQRTELYHKLTFSMMYFKNERYLLPFSHDEAVHGKATILQKMNGEYKAKFPQARALYLYMTVYPGKKLNFMGNEIGQLREWDEKREQDWELRKYPLHDSFYHYISELNKIYLKHPSLSEWDYTENGFKWLDCHQEEKCLYAIQRKSKNETIAAVFNFGGKKQIDYKIALPEAKKADALLYTDWERFGGNTPEETEICKLSDGVLFSTIEAFSGILIIIKSGGTRSAENTEQ